MRRNKQNRNGNKYIALDGKEYPTYEEVERANNAYWTDILIPASATFKTVTGMPIVLPPSIQIEYYKNVLEYLNNNTISYEEWKKYYYSIMTPVDTSQITLELALILIRALISAHVNDATVQYNEIKTSLISRETLIEEALGKTRK